MQWSDLRRMLNRVTAVLLSAAGTAMLMGCAGFPPDMGAQLTGASLQSYAEAAEALRELGIGGLSDDCIGELEETEKQNASISGSDRALMLLYMVGCGTYDPETWAWTPGENGVYCFDMEVFAVDTMYTDFLRGISAIGCGELEFTDIREDTGAVDWETGTGERTVSFCWNGETYTLRAKSMDDWFDPQAAKQLSSIIRKSGSEKRLYFTNSGQICYAFYGDPDWAKAFSKTTGIPLHDGLF